MSNLSALADREGINSVVELINSSETNTDGSTRLDAYRINEYYSRMTMDKIAISQDQYVFLKYATTYGIPKGHGTWVLRKKYGLTEHLTPLLEGIPPRSDKTRRDRISGTYHQYGRYMEVTDRVDFTVLDPLLMEYAQEYGDVAVRTMHRLARKEMLNSTFVNFANNKLNKGELVVGDYVGLADFRLAALKMARLAVRPIGGTYKVITSEEHYWDLMKDPLIVEYIGTNNGLSHYKTGELPELFGISFEKTQMDDFAYGYELGNPGEWMDDSNDIYCRVYMAFDNGNEYGNIAADPSGDAWRKTYVASEYREASVYDGAYSRSTQEGLPNYLAGTDGVADASETYNRLADGSWVPVRVVWNLTAAEMVGFTETTLTTATGQTTKTQIGSSNIYYTWTYATDAVDTMTFYFLYDTDTYETIGTVTKAANDDHVFTVAEFNGVMPTVKQLPIHTAIMIGEEALARLEVEGRGNVQVFAKPKGSAGVLDPIDQRQSIGFKIDAIGFKRIREESIWLFHHVPTQATATAGISL